VDEAGAHDSDVLVIGSGIAGLTCALTAAAHSRVTVLAKTGLGETSTSWAQGGIAAAVSPVDSVEQHYQDTLATGAGLCHPEAVRVMVEAAPERVAWLQSLGVRFTMDSSSESPRLDLGKEAAHSHRRIVHAADLTGLEIQNGLVRAARASDRITLLERHFAVDLITSARLGLAGPDRCLGAYVLDRVTGRIETFRAGAVVLATGGAGKVYLYTTNPDVATGTGSRWPGARAPRWGTSSSTSSTRPASTIRGRSPS